MKFPKTWEKNHINLDALDPNALPPQLHPKGLDAKRQQYLYNEIREFVREDKWDLVCPLPRVVNNSDSESEDEVIQPPVK